MQLLGRALELRVQALVAPKDAPPAPEYWWVAPLVTFAAVLVALITSTAGVRLQTRAVQTSEGAVELQRLAIADNRALRIFDDVRRALADTLVDLHALHGAAGRGRMAIAQRQLWRMLTEAASDPAANTAQREFAEPRIRAAESAVAELKDTYESAVDNVRLQTERLRLLLGDEHPLTKDLQLVDFIANLFSVRDAWDLPPIADKSDEQLLDEIERSEQALAQYRDRFRETAQRYVEEHQAHAANST